MSTLVQDLDWQGLQVRLRDVTALMNEFHNREDEKTNPDVLFVLKTLRAECVHIHECFITHLLAARRPITKGELHADPLPGLPLPNPVHPLGGH